MSGKANAGSARHGNFIRAWQSSGSPAEVAAKLGCTPGAARTKAWWLRAAGVDLKVMPRGEAARGRGRADEGPGRCECGKPRAPRHRVCETCKRLELVGYDGIRCL